MISFLTLTRPQLTPAGGVISSLKGRDGSPVSRHRPVRQLQQGPAGESVHLAAVNSPEFLAELVDDYEARGTVAVRALHSAYLAGWNGEPCPAPFDAWAKAGARDRAIVRGGARAWTVGLGPGPSPMDAALEDAVRFNIEALDIYSSLTPDAVRFAAELEYGEAAGELLAHGDAVAVRAVLARWGSPWHPHDDPTGAFVWWRAVRAYSKRMDPPGSSDLMASWLWGEL